MSPTPRELGFRWPAEWEPQRATWLAWPHNADDWPGKFQGIERVFGEIIRRLAETERVGLIVESEAAGQAALRTLGSVGTDLASLELCVAPTNRSWTRDFVPTWLVRGAGSGARSGARSRHMLPWMPAACEPVAWVRAPRTITPPVIALSGDPTVGTSMTHTIHQGHDHVHGANCGHLAVQHAGHVDYLHDGHLHNIHGDHVDEHTIAIDATNPAQCTPNHRCTGHAADHVHDMAELRPRLTRR